MAAPVSRGDELELQVDSLAYGGNGVARLNGFVVFVRRGLPGDTVRAEVTKVKRGFAEATATEVLVPSAERTDAPCKHYHEGCGGCRFQDLRYEAQIAAKEAQVGDALRRIGRIAEPPLEPILPAEEQFHYRNKLEYSFTATPRGAALGFHRAGRWDEVLEVDRCWLTTDLGNSIREAVRDWAQEEGLPPFDQEAHTGYLRHLVVREGRNTGQALVQLVTAPGDLQGADRLVAALRRVPRGALDPLGGERLTGGGDQPADQPALGRGGDRGADPRFAFPRAAERVHADEHRDGGAAVRPGDRVRGPRRGRDGLRPLLRHRDDRSRDVLACPDGVGAGGERGIGRLRNRERRAERDHECGVLRGRSRRVAGGPRRPRREAGRGGRRPAARGALGEGAAPARTARGAEDRLRLLQPDHARREREGPRRGVGLHARSASSRSTCFRTRRTSSR